MHRANGILLGGLAFAGIITACAVSHEPIAFEAPDSGTAPPVFHAACRRRWGREPWRPESLRFSASPRPARRRSTPAVRQAVQHEPLERLEQLRGVREGVSGLVRLLEHDVHVRERARASRRASRSWPATNSGTMQTATRSSKTDARSTSPPIRTTAAPAVTSARTAWGVSRASADALPDTRSAGGSASTSRATTTTAERATTAANPRRMPPSWRTLNTAASPASAVSRSAWAGNDVGGLRRRLSRRTAARSTSGRTTRWPTRTTAARAGRSATGESETSTATTCGRASCTLRQSAGDGCGSYETYDFGCFDLLGRSQELRGLFPQVRRRRRDRRGVSKGRLRDQCLPGWGDCDGVPRNGCETNIKSVRATAVRAGTVVTRKPVSRASTGSAR